MIVAGSSPLKLLAKSICCLPPKLYPLAAVRAFRAAFGHRADRILVLNKGKIVESGTHAALLEQRGLYHYLYTLRLSELPM